MSKVTFKGNEVRISKGGQLPKVGEKAPGFKLVATDLSDKGLGDFAGKRKVLNIVPSLDTPVCATSARRFNEAINGLSDTVLLNISLIYHLLHRGSARARASSMSSLSPLSDPASSTKTMA